MYKYHYEEEEVINKISKGISRFLRNKTEDKDIIILCIGSDIVPGIV